MRVGILPSAQRAALVCLCAGLLASTPLAPARTRDEAGADSGSAKCAFVPDTVSAIVAHERIHLYDRHGSWPPISLGQGEQIRSKKVRGRIGIVITSQRAIFFAEQVPEVPQTSWGYGEFFVRADAGVQVGVAITNRRVVLFEGRGGALCEMGLQRSEIVDRLVTYDDVAVVATTSRLIALSAGADAPVQEGLRQGERAGTLEAQAGLVTVATGSRLLQYRAQSGRWNVLETF